MKNSRTLLTYHDLNVVVEDAPDQELLEHMHSTLMGQPGGLRYHHTNLEERMMSGDENYFMYLRKSGKMLGSVGFCGKPSVTDGLKHDSWLIRYFSIKAPMVVVPKKRKEKADLKDENKRSTVLGRFIQPIFAEPSQLRDGKQDPSQPSIIFGIIDQTNLRSMNFSAQMGLETVGEMAGFSFSRLRPKKSDRVEQIAEKDKGEVLDLLKEYYSSYTLFFTEPVFKNNDYFVIKEDGRVVAGVQFYPVHWKITDFGGRFANLVMRWLTKIPWVKKRITLEELSFLAFDAIYCKPGYEAVLYELMEGVLEHTSTYIALMMMDEDSHLYTIFRERKKLGVMHKFMGTHHADIRIRFINMPEKIRKYFMEHPTYIPTYDNS
ncbi:MAG: hypothetical protein E4H10_06070 [Bacteroidia bacterium]|nr:MAG: hypothetical protein E4H10_06070 [Bacteroidia bacterium]